MARGFETARWRLRLVFLVQAVAAGAFLSRIPDIQAGLGIGKDGFGLVLLAQPLAGIVLLPFAGMIVAAAGTRLVILFGVPLLAAAIGVVSVAPGPVWAGMGLALYGAGFAVTNVAMNVEADRIERASGERLLNSCHGMASLGLLATTLVGALLRGMDVPQSVHLIGLVPLVLAGTVVLGHGWMPVEGPVARRRIRLPRLGRAVLALVGLVCVAVVLEGTARTWSIIYMRDSFSLPEWTDTLVLTIFLGGMAGGRMVGDGIAARLGVAVTLRLAALVALGNLLLVAFAGHPGWAFAGFVLLGIGTSVIFPLVISGAARLEGGSAAENVAGISMLGAIVVLAAPALLGFIAEGFGIRAVFLAIAPLTLLALVLAGKAAD